ncbi:hypothetical protein EUTSA_v10019861mg, partial [Eutrema salsugineum]
MASKPPDPVASVPQDLLFLLPWPDPPSSSPVGSSGPLSPDPLPLDRPSAPAADLSVLPSCSAPLSPRLSSPNIPPLASSKDSLPSWASKFKSTFLTLSKVGSPVVSEDGIPQMKAPDSVILKSSQLWKNHLVAQFHGSPPSIAKIFSDLNPIWGKQGRISIKYHSPGIFLILIPCEATRKWALDIGFWHSRNCSFSLSEWSSSATLGSSKLDFAPVWVLFRNVPQELWSSQGFSTIASGVGFPVHSEFPNIRPYSNGVVKLKIVVELAKTPPPFVRVSDKMQNTVLVSVEFLQLPPKCAACGEFGHFQMRCPVPVVKAAVCPNNSNQSPSNDFSPATSPEGSSSSVADVQVCQGSFASRPSSPHKIRISKSLPSSPRAVPASFENHSGSDANISGVWTK